MQSVSARDSRSSEIEIKLLGIESTSDRATSRDETNDNIIVAKKKVCSFCPF